MFKAFSTLLRVSAAICGATLIAACGSSSPSSTSASSPDTVTLNGQAMSAAHANQDMVRFADCMRTHGVPGFPDPTTDPHAFKQAFDTTSPAFGHAADTCQHLLPAGGQHGQSQQVSHKQFEGMLAFARCVRSRGFPRFPDPTSMGLTHEMLAQAGINVHQPAVVRAADACVSMTRGVVTRAMVARFIAGS